MRGGGGEEIYFFLLLGGRESWTVSGRTDEAPLIDTAPVTLTSKPGAYEVVLEWHCCLEGQTLVKSGLSPMIRDASLAVEPSWRGVLRRGRSNHWGRGWSLRNTVGCVLLRRHRIETRRYEYKISYKQKDAQRFKKTRTKLDRVG